MFAAAANRLQAMKLLIAAGADVKASTKVVDLKPQTNPEEEEFLRSQQGQRATRPGARVRPSREHPARARRRPPAPRRLAPPRPGVAGGGPADPTWRGSRGSSASPNSSARRAACAAAFRRAAGIC